MRHVAVVTTVMPGHDHVTALEQLRGPVTVIRRCGSLGELLSVARAGLADVVLVAGATDQLTLTFLDSLGDIQRPIGVVALTDLPAERARIAGLGLPTAAPDEDPRSLADLLQQAAQTARDRGTARWVDHQHGPARDAQELAELEQLLAGPAESSQWKDHPDDGAGASPSRPTPGAAAPTAPGGAGGAWGDTAAPDDSGGEGGPGAEAGRGPGVGSALAEPVRRGGLTRLLSGRRRVRHRTPDAQGASTPSRRPIVSAAAEPAEPDAPADPPRITTVWGPVGSPGRTTVAVNLAVELSLTGRRTLLIDLDTYGASVGTHLGLLEESAGIARACRHADQGSLTVDSLSRAASRARVAGATVAVLTGLTRADRWPELRRAAVDAVLETARSGWDEIVVDVGFSLEQDEELSFDIPAPQRNAATIAGVAAADRILAVGTADAVGLPRLIHALDELDHSGPSGTVEVIINQLRPDASGAAPQSQVRAVWDRYGPEHQIAGFLPWDRKSLDRSLLGGQVLAEAAPSGSLRKALSRWAVRR